MFSAIWQRISSPIRNLLLRLTSSSRGLNEAFWKKYWLFVDMSMNFVTFNQDYSHLAIGTFNPSSWEGSSSSPSLTSSRRYLKRLSNIHHRSFFKMLRDQSRRYHPFRNALLNFPRSSHSLSTTVANHEYQSMFVSSLSLGGIWVWREETGSWIPSCLIASADSLTSGLCRGNLPSVNSPSPPRC